MPVKQQQQQQSTKTTAGLISIPQNWGISNTTFWYLWKVQLCYASLWYNVQSIVILSIKIFLQNKIISSCIWSWHTPHLQNKLHPFGVAHHTQTAATCAKSQAASCAAAAPHFCPSHSKCENKATAASSLAHQSESASKKQLFNRKRACNKYMQNHIIF